MKMISGRDIIYQSTSKRLIHVLPIRHFMFKEILENKKGVERTKKTKLRKSKLLALGEPCKALF